MCIRDRYTTDGCVYRKERNITREWRTTKVEGVDLLTLEELVDALNERKNRKAAYSDGMNLELLKYDGILLLWRRLHSLNQCWITSQVSEAWKT